MRPASGRGEGDEDLAAPVVGDRAAAREPEACSARDALELMRGERRIDGDDRDTASRLRASCRGRLLEERADRDTVHDERRRGIEVRQDEHADGTADRGRDSTRRSDACLVALRQHPRPASDGSLGDGAGCGSGDGTAGVLCVDLHDAALRQPAVVALAHHGDDEILAPDPRVGGHCGRDGAVVDAPHRVRGREVHGRLDAPPVGYHHRPGQLSCAVQHRHAGRHRLGMERLHGCRDDRGHARTRDSATVRRLRLVAPHRHVSDRDTRDVGDRIRCAGVETADPEAELAEPRPAGRRCAHVTSVQTDSMRFMLRRVVVACRRSRARAGTTSMVSMSSKRPGQ